MLLPINTDAPIYHFPWVTISLIGVNVAAFVAQMAAWIGAGPEAVTWVDDWILTFGHGLHPLQWVSWAFLHADPFHIIGNMFFLWGFGLVVEGKLGWWRYLGLYLGIAAVAGFFDQLIMLGYDGDHDGALGASGVIFGLMAMSLVWAPKNDMTIFMLIFYHPHVFEASILVFCGCYIALQVLYFALDGFSMGSALLHLTGAGLGAAVGLVMLKKEWVDCEGWDIFAVINNTYGRRDDYDEFRYRHAAWEQGKIATPQAEPEKPQGERVGASALDPRHRIRRFLEADDAISALGEYEKLVAFHPTWQLDRETLGALGEAAYKTKSWEDAEPLMRQYLERFPQEDPTATARIQLKLAKYFVDVAKRPKEGLALLGAIDPATLPPKPAGVYQELRKRAESSAPARKS